MKNLPLPKGWQELQIKDVGDILGGGTPSTKNKEYWNGSILWLTPTEVTSLKTKYLYDTERKITELGLKNSSARIIKPNSLIICTRATIGDCCINKKEISTNQGFKSITPNSNFDVVFLYYLISYNRNILILNSSGSTFLEISKSNLENLSFYFPPLDEQKRIAEVLSLCDDVIENLTKLIEKKELYKKGVMQRVLSGEVRFKGFKDEWQTVRLGDICQYKNGNSFEDYIDENGNLFLITLDSITIDGRLKNNHKKINIDSKELLSKNDIVMILSDIAHGYFLGLTAVIDKDDSYVLNQRVALLKPNNTIVDSYFLSKLININQKYFKKYGQGSSQQNLSKKSVENFILKIPSLEEQKKIGEFLSVIDEEIDNLKKQLELRKQQKKGLMQRLLTGEVRI